MGICCIAVEASVAVKVCRDKHVNSATAFALLQLLSMEFCYLTMTTIASTWFGIAVFYTILDQLLKVTFNSSEVLKQVSC